MKLLPTVNEYILSLPSISFGEKYVEYILKVQEANEQIAVSQLNRYDLSDIFSLIQYSQEVLNDLC